MDAPAIQKQLSQADINILAQAGVIPHGTPEAILKVFATTANQHGLSPFKKEIYLVPYKGNNGMQYSTIVGIDGMRAKAARTGTLAGKDDAKFDLQPDGNFKTAAQLKSSGKLPESCTITVYKMISGYRCPFTKTVIFSEYCPASKSGKWGTMPFNMIEKCAEAAALRAAFADETSGLNIEEESAAIQDITIQAAQKTPSIQIDEDWLKEQVQSVQTIADLTKLYGSNPAFVDFAYLFTERKEQIADELQRAGKL